MTLRLRGGREVTGLYQGQETIGPVTFVKLSAAHVAEPEREKSTSAEVVLLPVELVELAAVPEKKSYPPAEPGSEPLG